MRYGVLTSVRVGARFANKLLEHRQENFDRSQRPITDQRHHKDRCEGFSGCCSVGSGCIEGSDSGDRQTSSLGSAQSGSFESDFEATSCSLAAKTTTLACQSWAGLSPALFLRKMSISEPR
jgi:hypothetical protein